VTAQRFLSCRRVVLASGLLLGGLLLAACGGGAAIPTTTTTQPGPVPTTTIPYAASKNARADVTTDGACAKAGGAWVLQGAVRNSATFARSYQIVVDYVTVPGNTVIDTRIVTVPTLNPAASTTWSSSGAHGSAHVACIIRQVQFSTS
jgi:hypothetical protein